MTDSPRDTQNQSSALQHDLDLDAKDSDSSQDGREMEFTNAPNLLTLTRILMVPAVVACLFMRTATWDLIAAILFGIAAITDWFDGYLARKQNLVTIYGKLMDPLADKFLVVSSLCMLQELGRIHPVVVIVLICREMAITGLRALASSEGLIISASDSAKWKTATQMVGIPFLMAQDAIFGIPLATTGRYLIWISLGISLWSANSYIFGFFRAMSERRKQKRAARKALREKKRAEKLALRESKKLHK